MAIGDMEVFRNLSNAISTLLNLSNIGNMHVHPLVQEYYR